MRGSPKQLILDWPHAPSFAREDFLVAPSNREAARTIGGWPDWPARMLLLQGPEGAGKSHLAALWVKAAHAVKIMPAALGQLSSEVVATCHSAVLIEDVDRVGESEERLFHFVNSALHNEVWLLMTARASPSGWKLKIPDLLSRLRLAPIVRLEAPDIELTEAVLFKLFSDRQLRVEPHVVAHIAKRIERSLGAARRLVAILDRMALAEGRRVTRALANESLREIESQNDSP